MDNFIFPEQISMPVHALSGGSFDPDRPLCPVLPVTELHGRTLRKHFARMLPMPSRARNGDIVGVRVTGAMVNAGAMVSQTSFLVEAAGRLHEYELTDLPEHQQYDAMRTFAAIDRDWGVLEEFPEEILMDGDGHCLCHEKGPRYFEMIHCRQALHVLWLDRPRMFNQRPILDPDHVVPSAVLIEESDLAELCRKPTRHLDGIRDFFEKVTGLQVEASESPPPRRTPDHLCR